MSEESHLSQPIPLSQAQKLRRLNDNNDKIELSSLSVAQFKEVISECVVKSEQRQKVMMSKLVNEEVSSKIIRLENSINKLISQFKGVRNGTSEDAAFRITTDSAASDIALASIDLPKEELYPYTCGMLAEKLELRQHDILQIIKKLNLRNNDKYHYSFKTGIKSEVQKWSEAAYQKLKQALDSDEYLDQI